MRTTNSARHVVEEFDGWNDYLEALREPWSGIGNSDMRGSSRTEWTGTYSFDQALRLGANGWSDGLHATEQEFQRLATVLPKGDDLVTRYTEAGDEPDVGLYLEGDPENMIEFPIEPKGKPVAKLVVSTAISSGISTEAIFRRGAVVMAVVDSLESMGVRMEIIADWTSSWGDMLFTYRIPVKHAEEPMDRDRVAFALCHPSMLRRLLFRLNERRGEYGRRGRDTYGTPCNPPYEQDAFIMPCMHLSNVHWQHPPSATLEARRMINEVLKLTGR